MDLPGCQAESRSDRHLAGKKTRRSHTGHGFGKHERHSNRAAGGGRANPERGYRERFRKRVERRPYRDPPAQRDYRQCSRGTELPSAAGAAETHRVPVFREWRSVRWRRLSSLHSGLFPMGLQRWGRYMSHRIATPASACPALGPAANSVPAVPLVHLRPPFPCDADFLGRFYQRLDSPQAQLRASRFDDHTPACRPPPSGPSCIG